MSMEDFSGLTYSDVLIEPQYSEVESRSKVDISSVLDDLYLPLPVISANMKNVTGPKMAVAMYTNGGMGVLHRFCTIKENVSMFTEAEGKIGDFVTDLRVRGGWGRNVGVSIGVKMNGGNDEWERCVQLYEAGARIFFIDIAHGHSLMMKKMIVRIREKYNGVPVIVAGNFATPQGAKDAIEWGANIIKVGIGPGMVCKTRQNTGVGVPQLEAIWRIRTECPDIFMIADGGIAETGDVPKALKYADAVMIGNMIAGTTETPGKVYKDIKGEYYKVYGGSASGENKVQNGDEAAYVEGGVKMIPFVGHVKYILQEINHGMRSAFSYSGSFNMKEFQRKCILKPIGGGARKESKFQG